MEEIAKRGVYYGKSNSISTERETSKRFKKEVHRLAKEYIEVLYASLNLLAGDRADKEELDRINEMVAVAYAEGLIKAIYELE